jgi:hypothetical protein
VQFPLAKVRVARLTAENKDTFYVKEEEGCLEKVQSIVQVQYEKRNPIVRTEILDMTEEEYLATQEQDLYEES